LTKFCLFITKPSSTFIDYIQFNAIIDNLTLFTDTFTKHNIKFSDSKRWCHLIFDHFGEQALDIVETIARSGAVDVIVVDSVATLTPKAEIEGDMGDTHVGLQARLMSQAPRKLTGVLHKMETTVIFINQIRMKIGAMGYGTPETTTGGNALKFYASVRVDVRRIATLKQGENQIGNRVKAKVVKNKVAPPFRIAEFDIMFGEGISKEGEIIDYGVKLDIIDKSGAWFSYKETKLGQGRENAKQTLKDNPELAAQIEAEIKEALGIGSTMLEMSEEEIKLAGEE